MRYRVKRFGVHSSAATVAVLYFILALLFVPVVYFASGTRPTGRLPAIILILGPVCYAIFGYIMTAIACWLYNMIASWTGGFAMTLEEEAA
ncbi:MAG: hypothetical protein ABI408_06600 [Gemmatimonadaceae bacterium]